MKRLVSMALALLVMASLLVPVNAADKGSIEILVKYNGTNITGGDLIAVRVGYVDPEKNIFRKFITNSEITDLGKSATVTQLQNFYTAYKANFKFDVYKTEVKNGSAKFSNIPQGLYLVYQETAASGYDKLPAFLVTLPYEGKLDVSVASKTALQLQPTKPGTSGGSSGGSSKLPQTGQLTWPVPVLAAGGMALFALGWWLCFGRKEDSQ